MPAFLQAPIRLSDAVVAVPSIACGTAHLSDYRVRYARSVGISEAPAPPRAKEPWPTGPLPVTALVMPFTNDCPPDRETLLEVTEPGVRHARRLLSLVTGDDAVPFATLVLPKTSVAGWVSVRSSRARVRIGDDNTGKRYRAQVTTIARAAERHERFAFALGLLQDAVRETDFQARIARLFNCLECLVPLNPRRRALNGRSRAEVKHMLGYREDSFAEYRSGGTVFRYDAVELAGRIRRKPFHATPVGPADLKGPVGDASEMFAKYPHVIADDLLRDCQRQIARTARRLVRKERPASR